MRYSLKFALWLALAAVAPMAGAGWYGFSTLEKSIRASEQERFRLAGREMVFRLEKKAALDLRGGVDPLPAMADEMRLAAEYLRAGAALITREGKVAAETGDPWGGAKDDLAGTAMAGEGPKSTVVLSRPCGRLCERYAAVSPIVPTSYFLVFSMPPGRANADLSRLAAEWMLAGLAAFFCALAVGLHVSGPLNSALRELREGARQFKKGNFLHVIAKGPPGDLASLAGEFNEMAMDVHVRLDKAEARSSEGYVDYEKLAKETHRVRDKLLVAEHLAGFLRTLDGPALARKIIAGFEMDLRAEDKSAITSGDANGWPADLSLHRALHSALDAARAAGKGAFTVDLTKGGFAIGFETVDVTPDVQGIKARIGTAGIETRVESDGGKTTITVSARLPS
ncbi:MAG: hypothetical protein HY897_05295 [Deltaproteobacteria bacterium]|nr:hypothetical protein [Deltaproteobacteria bacterium]